MIYRVENFKSLKTTGNIEISPLTIFIGPNGTGKSSALQPLLFLSQTMTNSRDDVGFLSNGKYIKTGNYFDFINEHDTKKRLKIFFDFGIDCRNCEEKCHKNKISNQIEDVEIGEFPPSKYEIVFRCDKDYQPELEKITIYDCLDRVLLTRKKNGEKQYTIDFFDIINNNDQKFYNSILKQMPQNFIFDDHDILDSVYQANREKKITGIKFEKDVANYLNTIAINKHNILGNLSSIKYAGPIREEAKRVYEYNKENYSEVGRFGEASASILFQNIKQLEKKEELIKWLKIFGLAEDFRLTEIPNHPELFVLEFKEKGKDFYINYADSCFGLSQLFPLLVQSVYSKANDIIIIEQPELHLNPSLESVLADFFVDMVNKKKRLVIETHSEYLLLRLRTYIKEGKISNEKVALYFTENIKGNSEIRKINIDESGGFPDNDWPVGFFEQSLSENLMLATAIKK
jgi:predicted ATPase